LTLLYFDIIELNLAVLDHPKTILILYLCPRDSLGVSLDQSSNNSLLSLQIAINNQKIFISIADPSLVAIQGQTISIFAESSAYSGRV